MKKKVWVVSGVLGVTLSLAFLYWFYLSKPTSFPNNDQLAQEMNSLYPKAAVRIIQDTIPIDNRHMLVPFITNHDQYGLSFWIWKNRKWQVASLHTNGGNPMIWKIDRNQPSSYRIVWNFNPKEDLRYIRFNLIRPRNFLITNGTKHYYAPHVQMEEKLYLGEKNIWCDGITR